MASKDSTTSRQEAATDQAVSALVAVRGHAHDIEIKAFNLKSLAGLLESALDSLSVAPEYLDAHNDCSCLADCVRKFAVEVIALNEQILDASFNAEGAA
jgi:hypothetical protein